jgi:hypothetical protein
MNRSTQRRFVEGSLVIMDKVSPDLIGGKQFRQQIHQHHHVCLLHKLRRSESPEAQFCGKGRKPVPAKIREGILSLLKIAVKLFDESSIVPPGQI